MSLKEKIVEERRGDEGLRKIEETGSIEPNQKEGKTTRRKSGNKGIEFKRKWGLVRCGGRNTQVHKRCPELLIVKKGQKKSRCTRCGTQRKVANKKVRAQSDDQGKVRKAKMKLESSENYSSLGDLDG